MPGSDVAISFRNYITFGGSSQIHNKLTGFKIQDKLLFHINELASFSNFHSLYF